jgi:hypothetical protein
LVEIKPPVELPVHTYSLVWAPAALRHPRVAFARNALMAGGFP